MERSAAMRSARAWIKRGRCVLLIACSGTKVPGGSPWPDPPVVGLLDQLQPADRTVVLSMRRSLASRAKAVAGPDLGRTSLRARYRPASLRYDGNLYRRVTQDLWPKQGDSCVIIVSALYGLVLPWEPIQDYDLSMKSPFGYRTPVHTVWRQAHFGAVFEQWAAAHGIRAVIDLLTKEYRAALDDLTNLYQLGIKRVLFEYPCRGSGANYDRGDDLKELLTLKRSAGR
jgi:hypothetical protein